MSGRNGWEHTTKYDVAEKTVSPNHQADYVSVHARVYWPHTATADEVLDAIITEFTHAMVEVNHRLIKEGKAQL